MMGCSAEGETEGFINIDDVSSGTFIYIKNRKLYS